MSVSWFLLVIGTSVLPSQVGSTIKPFLYTLAMENGFSPCDDANIADYNEKLEAMCEKKQIGYIDNSDIIEDEYYEEDGIHFKANFYPIWAEKMAEVATL